MLRENIPTSTSVPYDQGMIGMRLERSRKRKAVHMYMVMLLCVPFFCSHLLVLSSFWTSRGHRCRPFSPPVLAFNCVNMTPGTAAVS